MKFKNIILSGALILGSCSDAMLVAQSNEKSEQIKEAETKFTKFKKAIKCVWRKKGCDPKERRMIIAKGLAVAGAVLALGTGIYFFRQRKGPVAESSEGSPAVVAAPAAVPVQGRAPQPAARRVPAERELSRQEMLAQAVRLDVRSREQKQEDMKQEYVELGQRLQALSEKEKPQFSNLIRLYNQGVQLLNPPELTEFAKGILRSEVGPTERKQTISDENLREAQSILDRLERMARTLPPKQE